MLAASLALAIPCVQVDVSPLVSVATLEAIDFTSCSAIANVAPLAKITALKRLDVTDCTRVTDRRAFTANKQLTVVLEK